MNNPANSSILECKNEHRYETSDIFPLRQSSFEGVPALIPFAYKKVLVEEYTHSALTSVTFHNHTFDADHTEWLRSNQADEVALDGGAYA